MRWPWQRRDARRDTLVFSLDAHGVRWLRADVRGPQAVVLGCGQHPRPAGEAPWDEALLRQLGSSAGRAIGLLGLPSYQLLQIDAPAVPADELRSAARWHIRDRVDSHVDDLTLDVLRVGAPRLGSPGHGQLFVVAAPNTAVQALGDLAQQGAWPLQVIDVCDLAQRNLHSAAAAESDLAERATACLVQHDKACLLTLCVGDELYDSRRLDWDAHLVERAQAAQPPEAATPHAPGWAAPTGPADGPLSFELADGGLLPAVELGASTDEGSRLVVELQRSFDVWERSWPDLPLGLMFLRHDGDMALTAAYLQTQLGLRVAPLAWPAAVDLGPLARADAAQQAAFWPLLGALLRQEAVEP